ncbi:hypothetical protein NYE33_14555 [Paenibacillus sp. FSL R10-2199]|uniref:hypothetical protein n=1 Tax=Paenibacillus sp. FSL R10-2199 TaxID=2975348 RepID=UPI0030F5354F
MSDGNTDDNSFHFIEEENKRASKKNIRWFKEMINFDTLREAEEWVYNGGPYNKIGIEFEGYITGDPKLAYALLFKLIRGKTLNHNQPFLNIFADEEYVDGQILYMVWVS